MCLSYKTQISREPFDRFGSNFVYYSLETNEINELKLHFSEGAQKP